MRENRIRAIAEVADALFDNRLPPRDAAMFVASALSGWLAGGGSLERDFFKTLGPQGSHRTHAAIWREAQDSADTAMAISDEPHLDESKPFVDEQ